MVIITMIIYLLRHGEAERFSHSDAERALTPRGRDEVKSAAGYLLSDFGSATSSNIESLDQMNSLDALKAELQGLYVMASPYKRAQQSAEIVRAFIGHPHQLSTVDAITPDSAPKEALRTIEKEVERSACQRLLVVSHLPLVALLVGALVEGEFRPGCSMGTAYLVKLELDYVGLGMANLCWVKPPFSDDKSMG